MDKTTMPDTGSVRKVDRLPDSLRCAKCEASMRRIKVNGEGIDVFMCINAACAFAGYLTMFGHTTQEELDAR